MTHSEVRKYLPRIKTTAGYGAALEAILRRKVSHTAIALESINGDLRELQNRAFAVAHPVTGKQMEYKNLIKDPEYRDVWLRSKSNELGRLLQGVGKNPDGTQRIKGYDCCDAIYKHEIEEGRTYTYARTVCTVRPEKEEQN